MNNGDKRVHPISDNENYKSLGLTKREYFAAMAMQGILAGLYGASRETYKAQLKLYAKDGDDRTTGEHIAGDAIGYADYLLKQLES